MKSIGDYTPIEEIETPIHLSYANTSARAITGFLHAVKNGRLIGHRSAVTGKVLFPPLGACPESGTATQEVVELGDSGTVIGFTTVHLPIPGSALKPPFSVANILLDGADQAFGHLVSGCALKDVCIGMRVKAHWKPRQEWDFGLENIAYFEPNGEAPVDVDMVKRDCLGRAEAHRHA